jgi:ribosomal-protein-alanine N-acetyltransferase
VESSAQDNRQTVCRIGHRVTETEGWTARQATGADESTLRRLIRESERVALRFSDKDLGSHLTSEPFLLAVQAGKLRGFLACSARRHPHAALVAAGLDDECSIAPWLDRLLPSCLTHLRTGGFISVSFVGSAAWLTEPLQDRRFRLLDHIVAYETTDLSVPHPGNPAVDIRAALTKDFEALVDLDALDFHPIWRNSQETFRRWQLLLPYFVVAEFGDNLVGYCSCALVDPGHGHLVRMAVHPTWQGLGIGARLLAEAVRYFGQAGARHITLNTQEGNQRAQQLYRQFGFRLIGREAVALWREL